MNLELKSGRPTADGLYVVFVDTAMRNGWKEPQIVLWHKGKWNHRNTATPYLDPVYVWVALPVMSSDTARSIAGIVELPEPRGDDEPAYDL